MVKLATRVMFLAVCMVLSGELFAQSVAATESTPAKFTVDARVDPAIILTLDVRLDCDYAIPARQQVTLDFDGSHEFSVKVPVAESSSCTLVALLPTAQNVTYVGDGGSSIELDGQGCHFKRVAAGHSNFCQVHVAKEATRLTVYIKWVGGTGEEPNVNIRLECNLQEQGRPLWINSKTSQTWELEGSDSNGFTCSVFEDVLDTFRADQSDCRNLLIMPGTNEECTLVNTKVVKRIEMLNRYGLGVMILVMLAAGLLAIKRLVL